MRTTCVATRLQGGHANNALPQLAQATVNCRILPAHSAEEVRQALAQVIANADASDVILIAGKGHENYQEIAGQRTHFSDEEQARAALMKRQKAGGAD